MYDDVYNTKLGFELPEEHIPSEDDMKRCAAGDTSIIPELVNGLMGFIVNSIEWYLQYNEHAQPFSEDCISEGLLGLQEFVVQHVSKQVYFPPAKFIGHARRSCLNKINWWLRENANSVVIPVRTQRRRQEQMTQRKLVDFSGSPDEVFDTVWFNEFINMMDPLDRVIVQKRIAGESISKIADQLEMDDRTVTARLAELYSIYEGSDLCEDS